MVGFTCLPIGACFTGGVFIAFRIAASRRRAVSSSVYCSSFVDRGAAMATKVFIVSGTSYTIPPNWSATPKPQNPLHGVKLKISRADQHVADIEQIVNTFSTSHRIVREMEPDGLHELVKLIVVPIPDMLPVIVSEAVSHLRSALDNLAAALAVKNSKGVYFPIENSLDEFKLPRAQRKINNLPPHAQKLIHRLKPYKGGNNLLWAMNRLRNDDVHTRLTALIVSAPHWNANRTIATHIPATEGAMIEIEYPQTFEDQIVLARCSHGAKIEYDAEPVIGIAFRDIEFLEGESIVARLRQMVNLTKRIVEIFERYCF